MFMVVSQALVNLCVAVGLLPVTGVPLPLVSFGGSSGVAMGIALGLIHAALRGVRQISDQPATQHRSLEVPALPFAQPAQVFPPPAPAIVLPSPAQPALEPETIPAPANILESEEPVWADSLPERARAGETYPGLH